MEELDELLLLSGQDVPYFSAKLQIHQPTIKDIAVVGEKRFFAGAALLQLEKESLMLEDNVVLGQVSDFDIIMTMIQNSNPDAQMLKTNMLMVLAVLFPDYSISIEKDKILLENIKDQDEEIKEINSLNHPELKNILRQILYVGAEKKEQNLNPSSPMAKKIAEKLKKGRQKVAQAKGENTSSLLTRYVAILAVGECKDIRQLMNYTLPQLFEEYQRYNLKLQFDMNIKMRLAGAKDVETPKNWMDDLKEDLSVKSF